MTKNEVMALVAAILTALHDADSGVPASTLYILCGMDMDKWNTIQGIMLRCGWINVRTHFVTLTEKGTRTAIEINQALAKQAS